MVEDDARGAGVAVAKLAARRGDGTRREIRERINRSQGTNIQRQKFDQWCNGHTSFPNDFAEIMTKTYDLTPEEQVELALALSFGQRTRLLRR